MAGGTSTSNEHGKIFQSPCALKNGHRGRRRGGFKTDAEENNLLVADLWFREFPGIAARK